MIEICKLRESYEHKKRLDDDIARQFVDAVEHGLSVDCVIEIMSDFDKTQSKNWEIKRFLNSDIVRQSSVCCAAFGIKCRDNHDSN